MAASERSRAARKLGVDILDRDMIENLRQFRANPVPVQTFLPLYQEMVRHQRQQSEISSLLRKKQLLVEQKPFHFSQMNYEKRVSPFRNSHTEDCEKLKENVLSKSSGCLGKSDEASSTPASLSNRFRSKSCSRVVSSSKFKVAVSPKMTRSALLRQSHCRANSNDTSKSEFQTGLFEVKKVLTKKIPLTGGEHMLAERLRNARIQQKLQLLEYEKQIEEMNEKVKNRPLLFERQIQLAAVAKLQREYQTILKKEGLDDALIRKYSGKGKRNLIDEKMSEQDTDSSSQTEETSRTDNHSTKSSQSEDYSNEVESDN